MTSWVRSSGLTTAKMVSSPAMVPTISGQSRSSMIAATTCAAPFTVLMTTMLPESSMLTTVSVNTRSRRLLMSSTLRSGGNVPVPAVAHGRLHQAKLLYVAGNGGLGNVNALSGKLSCELLLGLDGLSPDDIQDPLVAPCFHRRTLPHLPFV